MGFDTRIQWLDPGRVMAECGPMRLIISAWQGRVPQKDACVQAAKAGFEMLEQVARCRGQLSCRVHSSAPPAFGANGVSGQADAPNDGVPPLAWEMIRAVADVDPELTPMAAVAGTLAQGVADWLFDRGMTKVVVNNGGDIAIRLTPGESVRVGLRPDMAASPMIDSLTLDGRRDKWGVATSGLEGRSLSRGVASAVTAIAGSASLADAAATAIANASFIEADHVIRVRARELDDQTDIPDLDVTVQAGPFTEPEKDLALSRAVAKANQLVDDKRIDGAWVVVDGKSDMTAFVRQRLQPLRTGRMYDQEGIK